MTDSPTGASASPPKPKPGGDTSPLPDVTPPNASFILQLFLVPMIIVSIIVALWMMFSWLAHMGTNPEDLVTDVEKLNDGSWQRALTLADLLRNPQYDHLKDDQQLAQRLADALSAQLADGSLEANRVNLRLYLARVLGEFRTRETGFAMWGPETITIPADAKPGIHYLWVTQKLEPTETIQRGKDATPKTDKT